MTLPTGTPLRPIRNSSNSSARRPDSSSLSTIFFIIYYFTLPVLVGWFPELMDRKVIGEVNLAYLFALSQFFMAWILAFLYVGAAAGWDRQAAALISRFRRPQRV